MGIDAEVEQVEPRAHAHHMVAVMLDPGHQESRESKHYHAMNKRQERKFLVPPVIRNRIQEKGLSDRLFSDNGLLTHDTAIAQLAFRLPIHTVKAQSALLNPWRHLNCLPNFLGYRN